MAPSLVAAGSMDASSAPRTSWSRIGFMGALLGSSKAGQYIIGLLGTRDVSRDIAGARPAVLLVAPVTPADSGNGLSMRAGMLLRGLARSHTVHVVVAPVFGGAAP